MEDNVQSMKWISLDVDTYEEKEELLELVKSSRKWAERVRKSEIAGCFVSKKAIEEVKRMWPNLNSES